MTINLYEANPFCCVALEPVRLNIIGDKMRISSEEFYSLQMAQKIGMDYSLGRAIKYAIVEKCEFLVLVEWKCLL